MNSVSWKQVTGWAGIAYVVIFLVMISGGRGPVLADSAADVRAYFEDNATSIALSTWGGALAFALFFLLFASGLRSLLGPADARNEGVWSRLSFASAVAATAIGGAGSAFEAVLAQENVLAAASDETVRTLAAFNTVVTGAIFPWALAVFVLGASVVILQSGIMAKWIGWLGLLVALLTAIGTLWPFTGDEEGFLGLLVFIGLLVFFIWTLGVAISMIRSDSHPVS